MPRAKKKPPDPLAHIAADLRALAVPVDEIAVDERNARRHDEANMKAIEASLLRFGQRQPLVVNRKSKTIEAGNGRYLAALSLGWSHVAVVWVEDDPKAHLGFALADNRTAELAEWDANVLHAIVAELAADEPGLVDDLAFAELLAAAEEGTPLAPVDTKPPPKMAWCLFGLPTVRYGEAAEALELLAKIPGIVIETSANDHEGEEGR